MMRIFVLLVLFFVITPAAEGTVREAHIAIDQPVYDEEGNHVGWGAKFSAHISTGTVQYWKSEQGTINYTFPDEKLTVIKQDIAKLAKEIIHNENKDVGRVYRIQFTFNNGAGQLSGLYFYNDVNAIPKNVADIIDAIKVLTGNG